MKKQLLPLFSVLVIVLSISFLAAEKEADVEKNPEQEVDPLVGTWARVVLDEKQGPSEISTVTIDDNGGYHLLHIGVIPDDDAVSKRQYEAVGAEVEHSQGEIDLATGEEELGDRKGVDFQSVRWAVQNDELHQEIDLGTMGGEKLTYRRIR